ncbi:MAG: hypothetical protein AAF436_04890 [Myxococcota bacterium]
MKPRFGVLGGILVVILGVAGGLWLMHADGSDDVLEEATAQAHAGNFDAAVDKLAEARIPGSAPNAAHEALRIRLIAANGDVRSALIELVKAHPVADGESLMSVLGTLHEALEQAGIDPKHANPAVTRYALGFGPPAIEEVESLPPNTRIILNALRAYEQGTPVETAPLEPLTKTSNELPRFIALTRGHSAPP